MDHQYFMTIDGDGSPTGFYPTDVWQIERIPADAIEITFLQYRRFLDNPGAARWQDGEVVVTEQPPMPPPPWEGAA